MQPDDERVFQGAEREEEERLTIMGNVSSSSLFVWKECFKKCVFFKETYTEAVINNKKYFYNVSSILTLGTIIVYNKSTKKHTFFSTERSALYVSCKEHGC